MKSLVASLLGLFLGGALSAQAPVKICPLGDSITQSFGGQFTARYYLDALLNGGGYAFDFVGHNSSVFVGVPADPNFDQDHEAYAGWQVNHIIVDLEMWTRETMPDVVLIHLGTNDLIRNQSATSTVDELAQCIDVIRGVNPVATILVSQLIPMVGRAVEPLNSLIPGMVASKDTAASRVAVVDCYTPFDPSLHLLPDGVHPNDAGERLLAQSWFDALRPFLSPSAEAPQLFGDGCAPLGMGEPRLRPIRGQAASLGRLFSIEILGAPASSLPYAVFGFDATSFQGVSLPLDLSILGATGCELLVAPELTFPLPNIGGKSLWTMDIPSDPLLVGGTFYQQAAFLNPTLNALGLVFSDALAVTIVDG